LVKNERETLEVLARLLSLHMARLLAPAYYRPEINKENNNTKILGMKNILVWLKLKF
jgi:hypothetical protein